LSTRDRWNLRCETLLAAVRLLAARFAVAALPLGWWRASLGLSGDHHPGAEGLSQARRLAAHVERAAWKLPGKSRCLAKAIALSWALRRAGINHSLVFAARPSGQRDQGDVLHAWVECCDAIILGELPGPWITVWRTCNARG
jgi:Transglutaminase-like superfamily